jgi:hypothetical protein
MTVDSLVGKMRKNTPVKESSAKQRISLRLKAQASSHFGEDYSGEASGIAAGSRISYRRNG